MRKGTGEFGKEERWARGQGKFGTRKGEFGSGEKGEGILGKGREQRGFWERGEGIKGF